MNLYFFVFLFLKKGSIKEDSEMDLFFPASMRAITAFKIFGFSVFNKPFKHAEISACILFLTLFKERLDANLNHK